MSKKNYDVGYKKPPANSRFKKGQSGNSAGRPKKRLTPEHVGTALDKALFARVAVNEHGTVYEMPKLEAFMTQMVNKALKGHQPTMGLILSLLMKRPASGATDTEQPGQSYEAAKKTFDALLNEIAANLTKVGASTPLQTDDSPSKSKAQE